MGAAAPTTKYVDMKNNPSNSLSPPAYREAVQEQENDVIVVANAGSGKTHLLVDHYFHLLSQGFSPQSIVAFTFTEKAALELKERILKALLTHSAFKSLEKEILEGWKNQIQSGNIGTIHQFCLRILQESPDPGTPYQPKIIDEATQINLREQILADNLRFGFNEKDPHIELLLTTYGMPTLQKVLRQFLLQWNKSHSYSPPELPEPDPLENNIIEALSKISQKISEEIRIKKEREHWLSFDDLEIKALQALKDPSTPLQKFLGPLKHFLVDEFQDTSPIQITILETLRTQTCKNTNKKILYCVGDPKQSIYRFRNVDRRLIEETEKKLLADGGRRFDFIQNFRSTPQVLELINRYANGAFPNALPSQSVREPQKDSLIQITPLFQEGEELNSEAYREREAQWVTEKILELKTQDFPLEKIAVLYRASASALNLMDLLKDYHIPFTVRGGRELLKRQEILDLKNLLFFLHQPKDNLSLLGVLRSPLFLLSDASLFYMTRNFKKDQGLYDYLLSRNYQKDLKELKNNEVQKLDWIIEVLGKLLQQSQHLSPYALLRSFVEKYDIGSLYQGIYGDWDSYLALEQYLEWIQEIERELPHPTLAKIVLLLKQLKKTPIQKAPLGDLLVEPGSLQLLTIHAAKGLQFETVFLIDLGRPNRASGAWVQNLGDQWGLKLPKPGGDFEGSPRFETLKGLHSEEEAEENKRLLYVALSRARDRLWIPLAPETRRKNSLQALLMNCLQSADPREILLQPLSSDLKPGIEKPKNLEIPLVGKTPPPSLPSFPPWSNVSELETLAACPLKHHFSYRERISEEKWDEELSLSQTALGTLLHQGIHQMHQTPDRSPGEILSQLLLTQALWNQEEAAAGLSRHLENYLKSSLYEKISQASEDYSELPFLLQLNNGKVRGQIDRLIRDDSGWCLIDFKFTSGKTTAKKIQDSYGFQLKTYALAAQKFLQGTIPTVEVQLLATRQSYPYSFSPKELQVHESYLEDLLMNFESFPLEKVISRPACHHCPYHHHVPICPVPKGKTFVLASSR